MPNRPPPRLAARVVLAFRRLLWWIADRIVPPEAALFEHSIAFGRTRVLGALAEHAIADALADGPATAEELAERLGLDADALHRVLRAAALYNLLKLDRRGRFKLLRPAQALRSDHPRSMVPWIKVVNLRATQEAWAGVTDTLRTGEPSFRAVHGRSVWEHFAANPEEERLFADAMRAITEIDAPAVVRGYPWPKQGTICDVAGGVGTLLAAILRARAGARGVLVDAPGVLGEAEGFLTSAGVRDRVELRPGDMFESVDAQADVYVLKNILHDWDDERCLTILRTIRAAMSDGARLVVVEALQERNVPDPVATPVDIHMLTQCEGGRERSAEEVHELMRAASIEPGKVRRTAVVALVEGVAA